MIKKSIGKLGANDPVSRHRTAALGPTEFAHVTNEITGRPFAYLIP